MLVASGVATLGTVVGMTVARILADAAGERVPGYEAAEVATESGVRSIANFGPRERLRVRDRLDGKARLLFLRGRAAGALPDGGAAWPDAANGRIVVFDRRGAVARVLASTASTARPLANPLFAVAADHAVWAVEGDGSALVFRQGAARRWVHSAAAAPIAAAAEGRMAAARSIDEITLAPVRPGDPLLWIMDDSGRTRMTAGAVDVPENALLGQLVNSGWVAFGRDGSVYFASALRPELRRYGPDGRLAWRATRPLDWPPPRPRFEAPGGVLRPVYTPVQHGLTVGPDGQVYVLGAADGGGVADHLYVFGTDGRLVRAARVPPGEAIFADGRGRVFTIPYDDAMSGTGTTARAQFAAFALPSLTGGDTLRLRDHAGKVVVVNFWASWCGPCRREMPQLDALARELDTAQVAVLGLNEDVDPGAARRFVSQLGIRYPSARGGGQLQSRYAYRGLPYTVILDREGRVAKAVYGFGESIDPIRQVVRLELSRER